MLIFRYNLKKELKTAIGQPLKFQETSAFGSEYRSNGELLGCNAKRSWFAKVTMKNDKVWSVE